MDLNKAMIIGRLTRDPELRTTPNGMNVCKLGIATSYAYNNKQTGQKVEQTEFHNVVLWSKLADIAAQYLKKGTQVYLEGRLQTSTWEKDGQKHYKTEIVADNMIMLSRAQGTGSTAPSAGGYSPAASKPQAAEQAFVPEELPTIQQDGGEDINVEDIPF
jgi:single-strand DNA-binding protein